MNLPPGLGGFIGHDSSSSPPEEEEKESIPVPRRSSSPHVRRDGRRLFEYREDEEDDFALVHQSENVSETLIGKEEREILRLSLRTDERLLFGTVARLYVARPDPNVWTYTGIMGALVLVYNRRYMSLSFQFRECEHLWKEVAQEDDEDHKRIMKSSRYRLLWHAELCTTFLNDYEVMSRKFHAVDLKSGVFGFSFAFSVDALIFDRWCRVVGRPYVSNKEVKSLNNLTSRADQISRKFRTDILFRRRKRHESSSDRNDSTPSHRALSLAEDDVTTPSSIVSSTTLPKRRRSTGSFAASPTLSTQSALLLSDFGISRHHMHDHNKLNDVVKSLTSIMKARKKSSESPKLPFPNTKKIIVRKKEDAKKKKRRKKSEEPRSRPYMIFFKVVVVCLPFYYMVNIMEKMQQHRCEDGVRHT